MLMKKAGSICQGDRLPSQGDQVAKTHDVKPGESGTNASIRVRYSVTATVEMTALTRYASRAAVVLPSYSRMNGLIASGSATAASAR